MTRKSYSRRHKKGGAEPYSSAASYGEYVNNSQNSQYDRVFSDTGAYAKIPGNTIIGAQGQNSNWPGVPNSQNLALIQKAGKRSKKRRGGIWGSVINQAIVPFSLLGMQQSYKRKRQGGRKLTRKHRKH